MSTSSPIAHVLEGALRDIGGPPVRRLLPQAAVRSVGPFVFFDHFGPTVVAPGHDLEVRPHPHIGLATVTWLFEGAIRHRDSLGFDQVIEPGALNWMTAGRGIVHSERTPAESAQRSERLHGLQVWVGLPTADEEAEPSFQHYPPATFPRFQVDDAAVRVLVGEAFGVRSPARTCSPILYADADLPAGGRLTVPADAPERAVYLVVGEVQVAGEVYAAPRMLVFRPGVDVVLESATGAHFVLLGGAPLDGPRHLAWNFVSSRPLRIEEAKKAWKNGEFPPVVGDDEFVPLPEEAPHLLVDDQGNQGQVLLFQQGEVLGEMTWVRLDADTVRVDHTGVREAARGGGWARKLVMRGVAWARANHQRIVPQCSYARRVLTEDESLHDVLADG